jgi:hypothetical protein
MTKLLVTVLFALALFGGSVHASEIVVPQPTVSPLAAPTVEPSRVILHLPALYQ